MITITYRTISTNSKKYKSVYTHSCISGSQVVIVYIKNTNELKDVSSLLFKAIFKSKSFANIRQYGYTHFYSFGWLIMFLWENLTVL